MLSFCRSETFNMQEVSPVEGSVSFMGSHGQQPGRAIPRVNVNIDQKVAQNRCPRLEHCFHIYGPYAILLSLIILMEGLCQVLKPESWD